MAISIRTPLDIGLLMRDQRQKLELTQAEVASRANVSLRWVADIEAGTGGTHITKILVVLDVLGLSMIAEETAPSGLDEVIARHRA